MSIFDEHLRRRQDMASSPGLGVGGWLGELGGSAEDRGGARLGLPGPTFLREWFG